MLLFTSLSVFTAVVVFCLSVTPAWDQVSNRYVSSLIPMLDALSLDQNSKLPRYLRCWGILLAGNFFVMAFVMKMPPVAFVVTYFIYVAPRMILTFLIQQRRKRLRDQMADAAVALANCCRAGLTLVQGIEIVATESPQPLAAELGQIVHQYKHGRPLPQAIRETKDKLNEDCFTLFASAIVTSLRLGGRTTDALERISKSLQDAQRIDRKLAADTANGKMIVKILAAFPFLYMAGSWLMFPQGATQLFTTTIGQLVLSISLVIIYLGVRCCQKVVEVEL